MGCRLNVLAKIISMQCRWSSYFCNFYYSSRVLSLRLTSRVPVLVFFPFFIHPRQDHSSLVLMLAKSKQWDESLQYAKSLVEMYEDVPAVQLQCLGELHQLSVGMKNLPLKEEVQREVRTLHEMVTSFLERRQRETLPPSSPHEEL